MQTRIQQWLARKSVLLFTIVVIETQREREGKKQGYVVIKNNDGKNIERTEKKQM